MVKALIKKIKSDYDYNEHTELLVITADNEDKLFALFFREYDNRYKYCNDIAFTIQDDDLRQRYLEWISDVSN